jgi:hypothetical protein
MKEKDNIEKIILKNIDRLNDFEPREGHFDRFEANIKLQHKRKKNTLNQVLKIAAADVFVLLAANQAFLYFSPGKHPSFFQHSATTKLHWLQYRLNTKKLNFFTPIPST